MEESADSNNRRHGDAMMKQDGGGTNYESDSQQHQQQQPSLDSTATTTNPPPPPLPSSSSSLHRSAPQHPSGPAMLWMIQNTTVIKVHVTPNETHNTSMLFTICETATLEKIDGHSVVTWELIPCLSGPPLSEMVLGVRRAGRKQRFELHVLRRPLWGNPLLMAAAREGLQGLSPSALHHCASVSGVDTIVLSVELQRWRRWRPEQPSWATEIASLAKMTWGGGFVGSGGMNFLGNFSNNSNGNNNDKSDNNNDAEKDALKKEEEEKAKKTIIVTESVGTNTSPPNSPRDGDVKKLLASGVFLECELAGTGYFRSISVNSSMSWREVENCVQNVFAVTALAMFYFDGKSWIQLDSTAKLRGCLDFFRRWNSIMGSPPLTCTCDILVCDQQFDLERSLAAALQIRPLWTLSDLDEKALSAIKDKILILRDTCASLDKHAQGKLSYAEWRLACQRADLGLATDQVMRLERLADPDNNGVMSWLCFLDKCRRIVASTVPFIVPAVEAPTRANLVSGLVEGVAKVFARKSNPIGPPSSSTGLTPLAISPTTMWGEGEANTRSQLQSALNAVRELEEEKSFYMRRIEDMTQQLNESQSRLTHASDELTKAKDVIKEQELDLARFRVKIESLQQEKMLLMAQRDERRRIGGSTAYSQRSRSKAGNSSSSSNDDEASPRPGEASSFTQAARTTTATTSATAANNLNNNNNNNNSGGSTGGGSIRNFAIPPPPHSSSSRGSSANPSRDASPVRTTRRSNSNPGPNASSSISPGRGGDEGQRWGQIVGVSGNNGNNNMNNANNNGTGGGSGGFAHPIQYEEKRSARPSSSSSARRERGGGPESDRERDRRDHSIDGRRSDGSSSARHRQHQTHHYSHSHHNHHHNNESGGEGGSRSGRVTARGGGGGGGSSRGGGDLDDGSSLSDNGFDDYEDERRKREAVAKPDPVKKNKPWLKGGVSSSLSPGPSYRQ